MSERKREKDTSAEEMRQIIVKMLSCVIHYIFSAGLLQVNTLQFSKGLGDRAMAMYFKKNGNIHKIEAQEIR